MWEHLWDIRFSPGVWGTVWDGFSGVGTVGTLTFTLLMFTRERKRNLTQEARQIVTWIQSPGCSTDEGINTYSSSLHLLNQSPRPIHRLRIAVKLPKQKVYEQRRQKLPSLVPPPYNEAYLQETLKIDWGLLDGGLAETIVPGDARCKTFESKVPMQCVDVLVDFLDGDGQHWQRNLTTGKLRLLDKG
ncbi:Uncharacterised protein [Mycobacteroides abscessus subsp. abscessus]|nr:Uncharacterised protein [Mycobacteroides abscessus subsp. abscessus]SHS12806.1 Uncharacterised protein [Mycobacteroides abscessus subsp. abscessus]SHS21702.1 Uncharacterised protein [Mycobacteroides abscessus subsp. abscessus]SKD60296.1 Uncharacterised protein [Mycobacteroides abscessus subsp. abscessus]SKH47937.1 Uncharacterised protein [Mycobacteroides abscessus subsp. abscessus]